MSSIIEDVKHMLGLLPADHAFDSDVKIHVNSVFAILTQLGVGPHNGFVVGDATEWEAFVSANKLNNVKSYVFLRVKLMFDPPTTGFTQTAMDRQIEMLEWRMLVAAEDDTVEAEA